MTYRISRGLPFSKLVEEVQKYLNALSKRVDTIENETVVLGVGVGSSTNADAATQPAKFEGGDTPVAGNMVGININKSGYEGLFVGINKNSVTGEVPANAVYFSTYVNSGVLSFGRGNSAGAPNYADIKITSTGKVEIQRSLMVGGIPTSAAGLSSGDFYTQTATELGGSGTIKVVCVV